MFSQQNYKPTAHNTFNNSRFNAPRNNSFAYTNRNVSNYNFGKKGNSSSGNPFAKNDINTSNC